MSAKLIGALGAVLVALTPMALSAQSRPPMSPSTGSDHGHGDPKPGAMNDGSMKRGSMDHGPMSGSDHRMQGGRSDSDMRSDRGYGNWDDKWGARPSAPPRHWNKQGDWYRHVRACQQRYRSYNARTDMFTIRRGVMRRCML